MDTVISYVRDQQPRYLDDLCAFLRIESVSADSNFAQATVSCAEYVAGELRAIGLNDVAIYPTAGYPVVFGQSKQVTGRPTILVYGHYDVQPPDPLDKWITGPFEPTVRDGYLYARGVSDDKGQVLCHLKAIEAWLKVTGELPVNIKVIIEGEEEIGSPNLLPFLQAHKALLQSDVALVSDTPMLGYGQPSICTSLRGLLYVEVTATGCGTDLHSGQHGGAVPNAIAGLVHIVDRLKDETGRVTIPGFYDDVKKLSDAERQAVAHLPHSDEDYMASIGATALCGEAGFHTLERRWYRPTLDVNGIWGGYMGEGSKTVIPNTAHAKFSMRLVAHQSPEKIYENLKRHLDSLTPPGISLSLTCYSMAKPSVVDSSHPAVLAGLEALTEVFGVQAVLQGEGGTIPVVADFQTELGIPTVLMGFNLPDDQIHAPNERFALDNFYKGIEASVRFFDKVTLL
jgi:acetylornithine deacetylase/succinyl-diaminopimelate desuccinylase-like protein